ncbi:MAG TPA: exodeoxyribonuclease III [Candidatus Baltobacteraceae bacterium]|jgi:exodeoxyribonuclease-3|nr:exodeoxyribonuclease III [Candidatus Baltobacteraceae bacterium]
MAGETLRIVSLNCNGIRSAARKGFYSWMQSIDPDFVCLQETKAQEHQLPLEAASVSQYTGVFLDAERKGYSGVAIYAKEEPRAVVRGWGWPEYDREARWLQFDYEKLSIVSFYMPSGAMGPVRQVVKEAFMERFFPELARLVKSGRSFIICGDFNIAHREIDVYNPARCSKISGFFPHERAWIDRVLNELGWVDGFRVVNEQPKQFTWWSNFQNAFERNNGWRIDYELLTPDLAGSVRSAAIYRDQRFSDHAPVVMDYELALT